VGDDCTADDRLTQQSSLTDPEITVEIAGEGPQSHSTAG
jgi:hypothetical protein